MSVFSDADVRQPGNILIDRSRRVFQNVKRSSRRTYLTHVAFVCDSYDVQLALPQIIIVNMRTVPAAKFGELQAQCPPNVRLIRARSAWIDSRTCARIIGWLAAAVAPFPTLQPILLMDALKQHFSASVLRACARVRIWPLLVPARLTWLLQPLDTHAFARYKVRSNRVPCDLCDVVIVMLLLMYAPMPSHSRFAHSIAYLALLRDGER